MDNLRWKLVERQHLAQDQWIDFRKNIYELPDGSTIEPVYNYSKHSFSLIVPRTADGKYVCVRQYRHGIDEVTCEFPAGAIEYKDKGSDEPITYDKIIATEQEAFAAAKRELSEETGFVSDDWRHILTIPANPTLSNSEMHIYAADNCRKVADQELDISEFLNVELLSEQELRERMFGGDFKQPHHILAWYLYRDNSLQ